MLVYLDLAYDKNSSLGQTFLKKITRKNRKERKMHLAHVTVNKIQILIILSDTNIIMISLVYT